MDHADELIFLLPEYELEGYPRHLPGDSAARLLSGWVALWHPTLVCGVGKIPRWHQASRLPGQLGHAVFVLPPISTEALEMGAADRIRSAGGLLLEPEPSWKEFQLKLLANFPGIQPNLLATKLADSFAALGYGYLQVQLMTRQLRYTSNLDVAAFEEQVLRATEAVLNNEEADALGLLQSCFDSLGQERDHYYSSDAHLIDLTLVAESTLGKSLERQLDDSQPTSMIASVDLLRRVKDRSEDTWRKLRQRLAEGTLCLAGGMEFESPFPLIPRDAKSRLLQRAASAYRELQIEPPKIFARLSHGMEADAPSLLSRFDFIGAILIAFTGGKYPIDSQPKISWESHDGSRLPTLATDALDADDPNSYLALGWTIGEALDRQHVPTVVLAHWPGRNNEYFQLLKILTTHTPALGKWGKVDEYFATTEIPYHHQRLEPASFVYDWLEESQTPGDLILTTKLAHKLYARARCLQNLANLVWQLRNRRDTPVWITDDSGNLTPPGYTAAFQSQWDAQMDEFLNRADQMLDHLHKPIERYRELQATAGKMAEHYLHQLHSLLVRNRGDHRGRLLLNPRSNPIRTGVRSASDEVLDQQASWHFATGHVGENRLTRVDVPSMGFIVSPLEKPAPRKPENIVLADMAGLLKNEFIEAQIDSKCGHLRSLHIPSIRGNRLSIMVAYRQRTGSQTEHSEMVARQVSMLTCSNMSGIIRAKGVLQFRGKPVGDFEIDYEIQRGSRIIALKITLSDLQYPALPDKGERNSPARTVQNPWRSAFVLRWAWPTEAAILRTISDGHGTAWAGRKAVAPDLIEIDEATYRTYLLTGGLAFHSREDSRFAETILAVDGQTSVRHRVGLAVDLPYPLPTAWQFMDKPYEISVDDVADSASGWLLSVDSKNVMVNLDAPLLDSEGKTVGIRTSVSEMSGKSTTVRIRWFRDVAQAHRVNTQGRASTRLTTHADEVTIALRANELALVDQLWKV